MADERTDASNPLLDPDLFVGRDGLLGQVAGLLRQGRSALLIGGRRAGKSTLARHLRTRRLDRTLRYTDLAGWDLTSEASGLGALRSALEGRPETTYGSATRDEVVAALDAIRPLALVLDEADRVLLESWAGGFYAFLRWLDDTHLRRDISILLVGGPVLVLFKDPNRGGSPPLNTAILKHLDPLDATAVSCLADLAGEADHDRVMDLAGGQAWLTTQLLAAVWDGESLEDASDTLFDEAIRHFQDWEKQLGVDGRKLIRSIPAGGVRRSDMRWRERGVARRARSIGALRPDGERFLPGPRLFIEWLLDRDPDELVWDIAISYAGEDEETARAIYSQLRGEFKVFFAPAEDAGLWGADLHRVLPNTYGVQSRYVLVLSTHHYVTKYWTQVEYESVTSRHPERVLLLDMGKLPADVPPGVVYRRGNAAGLIGLVRVLREKLAE